MGLPLVMVHSLQTNSLQWYECMAKKKLQMEVKVGMVQYIGWRPMLVPFFQEKSTTDTSLKM